MVDVIAISQQRENGMTSKPCAGDLARLDAIVPGSKLQRSALLREAGGGHSAPDLPSGKTLANLPPTPHLKPPGLLGFKPSRCPKRRRPALPRGKRGKTSG